MIVTAEMNTQITNLVFKGYSLKFYNDDGFTVISHPTRSVFVEDIYKDAPLTQNIPEGYIYNSKNGTVTIG